MPTDILALLSSSNSRALLLVFMPATITGMFLLPNASLLLMEDNTSTLNDTSVSDEELKLSSDDSSCSSCHEEPASQIHNSPSHNFECAECHDEQDNTPCEENMSKISCMAKCHGSEPDSSSIGGFPAGGFGLTNVSGDTGSRAAHMGFINDAKNSEEMLDTNEACIGCHTHAAIRINWTHRAVIEFEAVMCEESTAPTHFDVENWNQSGSVNYTVWEDRNNKSLNFTVNLAT